MKRILLITNFIPTRKHAGGLRLLDIYFELRKMKSDLHITLVSVSRSNDEVDDMIIPIFDNVLILDSYQFRPEYMSKIKVHTPSFDLIEFAYHKSGSFIQKCRELWPDATILFSPMESQIRTSLIHLISQIRKLNIFHILTYKQFKKAIYEIIYILRADFVLTVSEPDRDHVKYLKHNGETLSIPTCLSTIEFPNIYSKYLFADKKVVVFFAYFGSETNCQALTWYIRKVHRQVLNVVPDYQLRIIGHGINQEFMDQFHEQNIHWLGSVSNAIDALEDASLGIAPAFYGSGTRGKIHQYSALGIPCVVSPLACMGLSYKNGESILIARGYKEFSDACVSILKDSQLRTRIGTKAKEECLKNYRWSSWRKNIADVYQIKSLGEN